MINVIVFVLFSWQIAVCEWTEPKKLNDKQSTLVGLYIDPVTNYGSALYTIEGGDPSLFESGTKQILPDKTFGKFVRIDKKMYLSGENTGADDGKTLFATCTTTRKLARTLDCQKRDTSGCFEIIFTESVTNGESWAEPIYAQRNDMNDRAMRGTPTIIYIKETGRIVIFYIIVTVDDFTIAMITRPPNSKIFSKERILFTFTDKIKGIKATYTISNGQPIYHIVFNEKSNLTYTCSYDAINWKPFIILGKSTDFYYNFIANTKISENTLVLTFRDHRDTANIMISHNQGINWIGPVKIKDSIEAIRSVYCGIGKVQKIYTLLVVPGSEIIFNQYFAEIDPKTMEVKYLESPKKNNEGEWPEIACAKKLDEDKLIVGISLKDSNGTSFLTFNEFSIKTQ